MGCITLGGGFEAYCLFEDNLNSKRYIEILFENLVPIYTDDFIFQQDNSSIHTSKITKNFIKNHDIKTIEFPPNSPDLNPIENMWHLIKHYLSKMEVTNENFKESVIECCKKVEYSSVHNMISNMHLRLQMIIGNDGSHIKY